MKSFITLFLLALVFSNAVATPTSDSEYYQKMMNTLKCIINKVGYKDKEISKIIEAFGKGRYEEFLKLVEELFESGNEIFEECKNQGPLLSSQQPPLDLQQCIAFYYPEFKKCGKRTTDIDFSLRCREMFKKGKEKCQKKD